MIVWIFLAKLRRFAKEKNLRLVSLFIIHACFFYPPCFESEIKGLLKESYLDFFERDLIFTDFKNSPSITKTVSDFRQNNETDRLKKEDLNHPNFVKH